MMTKSGVLQVRKGAIMTENVHREEFNKPTLLWDKWENPFKAKLDKAKEEDADPTYEEDDSDDYLRTRFMITSLGIIPLESTKDVFKFYMVHTNFYLTRPIVDLIKSVEGIETLQIVSPYRVKLSVGNLFVDGATKERVKNKIEKYFEVLNERRSKQNT